MSQKVKKIAILVIILILAVSVIIQIAAEGFHEAGLYVLIGFVGSLICILFAKKVLAPLVQKDENYYEKHKAHIEGPDFIIHEADPSEEGGQP